MEEEVENPFEHFQLSEHALKLANALYNTYVQEKYPYLEISVEKLCGIFGLVYDAEAVAYLRGIFDELNEPIAVKDFLYGSKRYSWKILQFCEFEEEWKDGDTHIEVHIDEMYLEAMKQYMQKPFVNIKPKEA